ncbi:hypothetical protein [Bacillus bombysepticus]|uniref:hypothetical protein n=1 Tax=Bacillus bombysepticus TaxID=658666 RepID=UPI003019E2F3
MSKIQNYIDKMAEAHLIVSEDTIVDNFTIRDIKEYMAYMRKEVDIKNEQVKELIVVNATLEVKYDHCQEKQKNNKKK